MAAMKTAHLLMYRLLGLTCYHSDCNQNENYSPDYTEFAPAKVVRN